MARQEERPWKEAGKWVESGWSGWVEETLCIRKTPAGADLHQHLQGGDCIARRGG